MRVAIVLFEGFEELDAFGPYAVLAYARSAGADVELELVTREPAERVVAAHGLVVEPGEQLGEGFNLVIVPGGGWNSRGEVGAWAEAQRGELPAELARLHEAGAAMASVCTGAMLLSAAGITRGRPAVTHAAALEELAAAGAEVVHERVVDDGDLVTSGGVTAGIDLALWLVEREFGGELADRIAAGMEYKRAGRVWRGRAASPQTGAE
jgi:transcriptional regulator GlxA family with amidase domain